MTSPITMNCAINLNADIKKHAAFTLIEMIIVMMIISTMVTIILPYAAAGSDSRQLQRQCLNLAQLLRYAVTLAEDTKRPTRIVINPTSRTYILEIARGTDARNFLPADNVTGAPRYLGKNVYIFHINGFSIQSNGYYLLFDPEKTWPIAAVTLAAKNATKKISITGNRIQIDTSAI